MDFNILGIKLVKEGGMHLKVLTSRHSLTNPSTANVDHLRKPSELYNTTP